MNILENIEFLTEGASVFPIKKTEKLQQIAVALGEGAVLKKHTTTVPANLLVLKGEIKFTLPNQEIVLREMDIFEIPVKVEHEVTGLLQENLFMITKEL